ncbi:MAG TPA: hypothetical protein VM536_23035 [Chloroflexia bacterium]|nr:hypothetical protein [Chloroflexia bacterium]
MEETNHKPAITEANTDWEAGTGPTPVAHTDYSRASHTHATDEGPSSEANSDLGNLGRDVAEPKPVGAAH